MVILQIALHSFQSNLPRAKRGLILTIVTSASFTILFGSISSLSTLQVLAPLLALTLVSMLVSQTFWSSHSAYRIAVLKALGATRRAIIASHLLELLLAGVFGAIMGVMTGTGLLILIGARSIITGSPFDIQLTVLVSLLSTISAVCFSSYIIARPTWKVSTKNVAEILRIGR